MTKLRTTIALLFGTLPAWAQCSLCKLAVEQDPSLGKAFNKAIILMMVPALAVFAGVFLLAIRSAPGSPRGRNDDKRRESETTIDYSTKQERL
jgi:hypothetical protein